MNKKLLLLPLVALSVGTLTGCFGAGATTRSEGELIVSVYEGGYGTEWIMELAKKYTEKTGIKVTAAPDQSLLDRLDSDIQNPQVDIFMSHGIKWTEYVDNGYLEPLDDLYASQVEGTGKTFAQRLEPSTLEVSQYKGHYYKTCYTMGAGGFIYNIDMFEKNHWEVPTTYAQLVSLCQTIVDAAIPSSDEPLAPKIVPIAWSKTDWYWDYPVFEWWAQLAGMEKINQWKSFRGADGKYSSGYEVFNPDTNYKEFIQAYQMWYDLLAVSEHHSFSNKNPQEALLNQACGLFASGQAAMIPYAQWAKYEIQNNSRIQFGFDIAMMKTPRANASVTTDYNYNVGFGDSIIIPSNIPEESKKMAKDFIRYLATPEACKIFVEKARGAFLAFNYKDVDLGDLLQDTYIKSIYEKLTECTQFNLASMAPIAIKRPESITPWVGSTELPYAKAFGDQASSSPKGDFTPENVGRALYQRAVNGWTSWMRGISDN